MVEDGHGSVPAQPTLGEHGTTDDTKAAAIMSALPWVAGVTTEEGYLLAEAPPERSWELTKTLAEHSVAVKEMSPVEVSLERYFLEVTGDDSASKRGEDS